MSLYDRDYARDRQPQRGAYGSGGWDSLRVWSVNTWIIMICVGVFVVDSFVLPTQWWRPVKVTTTITEPQISAASVEFDRTGRYDEYRLENESQQFEFTRAVVDRPTGTRVGTATYQWMSPLKTWLHFSTHSFIMRIEFWRLIGFQFLHASLPHLLFNMLGLYFFGGMVEEYLGSKRYLAFYLLCGIFGALMYLLLNILGWTAVLLVDEDVKIPGLLFTSSFTPLVGASAGIFGVLMAGAFIAPRELVYIFGLIPMRLQTLAFVLVGIAFYTVLTGGNNAGGEAGHLGGAIAGFYFIRRPHLLHGFFDFLGRVDPTSHHYRHHAGQPNRSRSTRSDEVNRILDKINAEGLHSLTESEKRTLNDATRESGR
jgi:membrane associated rhomboid family serine protease